MSLAVRVLVSLVAVMLVGCGSEGQQTAAAPINSPQTQAPTVVAAAAESETMQRMRAAYEQRLAEEANDVKVLSPILTEWDDADRLAASTARIALSAPVARLQEIRRRAELLSLSRCSTATLPDLLGFMDRKIDTYMLFMTETNDLLRREPMDRLTAEANRRLSSFKVQRGMCKPSLPAGL